MNLEARQLAREAYRRFMPRPPPMPARVGDMLATRFDKQVRLICHPARRKSVLCTRRAGKTESVAAMLLKVAQENPDCVVIYVAPTLGRARELMWKPLKRFNEKFGFGGRPNETLLTVYLPNGAEVRMTGADKLKDTEKRRGDKVALVVIDEASVYPSEVLRNLIDDVFGPALEDVRGVICVMGTPGINCAGKWWELTRNDAEEREAGWEFFSWSVLDNPFMAHMKERLPEMKRERGWTDETPTFVREWLGRWVNDTGALVYRYNEALNGYDVLPAGHSWRHVVGVDLGFDDAFAFVVWAFSPTTLECFEVASFSESGLTPTQWAAKLVEVNQAWRPLTMRVDTGGLGKAFVADFNERNRYGFLLEAAEKKEKLGNIQLLNDDLTSGRLMVRRNGALAAEWKQLPKDPDDETKEDSRFPNHVSDAALYGWRATQHYLSERKPNAPAPGSPEEIAQQEAELEERLEQRERQRQQEVTQEESYGWGSGFEGFGDGSW
jgi:hypothetical protein